MPRESRNLTGRTFGRLTAILPTRQGRRAAWICECHCTAIVTVKADNLRSGHTTSCGCYKRDTAGLHSLRHGHTVGKRASGTHQSWASMLSRVTNPTNPEYPRYGGRGIVVCERWLTFENFLADMGERPDGLTIDRIDGNGDYEPGNCRWANREVQRRNQSRVKLSPEKATEIRRRRAAGESGPALARAFGVNHKTIYRVVDGLIWA